MVIRLLVRYVVLVVEIRGFVMVLELGFVFD